MGWDKMREKLGFLRMIGKNWVSPRFWTKMGFRQVFHTVLDKEHHPS
jgi:hypothetical protein